jgi:hypothetical protein
MGSEGKCGACVHLPRSSRAQSDAGFDDARPRRRSVGGARWGAVQSSCPSYYASSIRFCMQFTSQAYMHARQPTRNGYSVDGFRLAPFRQSLVALLLRDDGHVRVKVKRGEAQLLFSTCVCVCVSHSPPHQHTSTHRGRGLSERAQIDRVLWSGLYVRRTVS